MLYPPSLKKRLKKKENKEESEERKVNFLWS
jgi:hypothetical protein